MDMVATLIDSFHNFYYSVVKIVGATASACIILEVAYIGIMMGLGKFTQTNEMIIKMLSVGFTLFLCSHLLVFSEAMRFSLESIADRFIARAIDDASLRISMEEPWKAGWTMIQGFVEQLWELTAQYSEKTYEKLTDGGGLFSSVSPRTLFNMILVSIVKWFIRIIGLLFIIVIIYCLILYYMALLEYYFIVLLASIFLVFGLFQHTKFISEKCISSVFSHLVKVGVMRIILGVCFLIINETLLTRIREILDETTGKTGEIFSGALSLILGMLILGAAIYYLVQNGPQIASNFVTGGVSTNGLNLMQFAAKSAGLATAGAMLAASKGAAIGKSAASAAGSVHGAASAAYSASGGSKAAALKAGAGKALSAGAKGALGAANLATGGIASAGARAAGRIGSSLKNSYSGGKETGANQFGASLGTTKKTAKTDGNGNTLKNAAGKTQYEKKNVLSAKGRKMLDTAVKMNEKRTGQTLSQAGKNAFANDIQKQATQAREAMNKK